MERFLKELEHHGIEWQENCLLSEHSSFRIGGAAKCAVFPRLPIELIVTVRLASSFSIPFLVVGAGCNTLFDDKGFDGVVIFTKRMKRIVKNGSLWEVDAGVSLATLAQEARKESLAGMEFAHGIPGTLGGAIFMNAGAFGGEMKDVCISSRYYNLQTLEFGILSGDAQDFSYRSSFYSSHPEYLIVGATISLNQGESTEIEARMQDYKTRRAASQPLEYPSAGSVFKRPVGDYAGRLIEICGLKGVTVGGAQVSEKHAGFIINKGGATSKDVKELINLIQERVLKETGVLLECEIRFADR